VERIFATPLSHTIKKRRVVRSHMDGSDHPWGSAVPLLLKLTRWILRALLQDILLNFIGLFDAFEKSIYVPIEFRMSSYRCYTWMRNSCQQPSPLFFASHHTSCCGTCKFCNVEQQSR
jgi:hypothetical protein